MKIVLCVPAALMLLFATTSVRANEERFFEKVKDRGCYQCHRYDEKLIGPSFSDIRQRYGNKNTSPAVVDYLAKKIINGGGGAWGPTPMNSNPDISLAEAKQIVKELLR